MGLEVLAGRDPEEVAMGSSQGCLISLGCFDHPPPQEEKMGRCECKASPTKGRQSWGRGVSYLVSNSMRLVSTGTSVSGAAEGRRKEGGWVGAERTRLVSTGPASGPLSGGWGGWQAHLTGVWGG